MAAITPHHISTVTTDTSAIHATARNNAATHPSAPTKTAAEARRIRSTRRMIGVRLAHVTPPPAGCAQEVHKSSRPLCPPRTQDDESPAIARLSEVEPRGIEPLTFWLPARRSPS